MIRMLTKKQVEERYNYYGLLDAKKLKCTLCGIVIRDGEPFTENGEFLHPRNGCANADKTFTRMPGSLKTLRTKGIEPVGPKRYARAKRRGAKQASKRRPRVGR